MTKPVWLFLVLIGAISNSCGNSPTTSTTDTAPVVSQENPRSAADSIAYQTENLEIHRLSEEVYVHISFLQTESFGKVACNGMLVVHENQAVVFDSPADEESAAALIAFVTDKLGSNIQAVVATHFHADCVGGLPVFHAKGIPSYANQKTIQILQQKGKAGAAIPQKGFDQTLALAVGQEKVYAQFFGEGHTADNVIGYYPAAQAIFGGCLIKEVGATKGNLEDANVPAWPATVRRLKQKYPAAKLVIPGHGKVGGTALLDYTISLFQ